MAFVVWEDAWSHDQEPRMRGVFSSRAKAEAFIAKEGGATYTDNFGRELTYLHVVEVGVDDDRYEGFP